MTDDVPLNNRACFQMLTAGIMASDGMTHARCMGNCCVLYEQCLFTILFYQDEIKKHARSKHRRKPKVEL